MNTKLALRCGILLSVVGLGLSGGCAGPDNRKATRDTSSNFAVRIDHPCDDAAAGGTAGRKEARSMAFEITGFAPSGSSKNSAEQKAAVTQAAVIDALTQAVIESRRGHG